MQNAPVKRIMI